jgi:hypothetical protein
MTFKELKHEIKEEQKALAQEIKELKGTRKEVQYGYVEGLEWLQNDYRHTHIAYCTFFNNTPYEKIEQPREDNKPSKVKIDSHLTIWMGKIDEALRNCA